MTISEIKNTINSDIKRFSGRSEYDLAVSEWEEDLDYVNGFITNK